MTDKLEPTQADEELADAIEEAISDSIDMDWQPSWAVPAIVEIVRQAERAALERAAMMIEVASFQTDPNKPPHKIWTHGFETSRDVFAASIRALAQKVE